MKDRISSILRHFGLSSSRLADTLGVQRSGISHILSGRNNPSYDFLVKLLDEFPEINANWLLTGKGEMLADKVSDKAIQGNVFHQDANNNQSSGEMMNNPDYPDPASVARSEDPAVYKSKHISGEISAIEKVIILYTDGTFVEYKPGKGIH